MYSLPNRPLTQIGLLEILRLVTVNRQLQQGPPGIWVGTLAATFGGEEKKNLSLSLSEVRG